MPGVPAWGELAWLCCKKSNLLRRSDCHCCGVAGLGFGFGGTGSYAGGKAGRTVGLAG